MDTILSPLETRILGCLIEKQITTPDYYPLTLNALTNACNQKSNRDPVVSFEETDVVRGLDSLRKKGFAQLIEMAGSRIPKYQHIFGKAIDVTRQDIAILCELMLRGPQTVGEVKNHAARLYEFAELSDVEAVLQQLMEREQPLIVKLPRQPGRKESRFMHLLSGIPDIKEEEGSLPVEAATREIRGENERLIQLEAEVVQLKQQIEDLQQQFMAFRKQFE